MITPSPRHVPLARPDQMPAVRTDLDLYDHWTALLGPLGFTRRRLWVMILDTAGRVAPGLPTIDDVPPRGDLDGCRGIMQLCADVLDSAAPDGSIAVLYSRPGRAPISADDRSWARALVAAASAEGVRLWPVHFACDDELRVFAPDDLASAFRR